MDPAGPAPASAESIGAVDAHSGGLTAQLSMPDADELGYGFDQIWPSAIEDEPELDAVAPSEAVDSPGGLITSPPHSDTSEAASSLHRERLRTHFSEAAMADYEYRVWRERYGPPYVPLRTPKSSFDPRLEEMGDFWTQYILAFLGFHGPEPWTPRKHFGMCGQSCGCCRASSDEDWQSGCKICVEMWTFKNTSRACRAYTQYYGHLNAFIAGRGPVPIRPPNIRGPVATIMPLFGSPAFHYSMTPAAVTVPAAPVADRDPYFEDGPRD